MNDYDIDDLVADAAPPVDGVTLRSAEPLLTELREQIMMTDASRPAGAAAATPPERTADEHRRFAGAFLHRRWSSVAAVASVVAVLAAVGVGLWPGSADPAWAGWTPEAQPASQDDIGGITEACAAAAADSLGDAPDAENGRPIDIRGRFEPGQPVAVDIRGDGGLVVFDSGASCSAYRAEAPSAFKVHTAVGGSSSNPYQEALAQLAPTESLVAVSAGESNDPANSFVWGVRSPDVDAVTIDTPYGPVEAAVSGSVWLAWWPEATGMDISVTGTGTDGRVLVADTFGALQLDGE